MKVVVDANRLFSALLKDGSTRRAIYETEAALFAPEFLHDELGRHADELRRRSGLPSADFLKLVGELSSQIVWVPDEAIQAHLEEAANALADVDIDDVPCLACALAVAADAVWSHDRDFDRQDLVRRVGHPSQLPG